MNDLSNRTDLRLLRDDLEIAINAVAEKHNLQIRVGSCTYAATNCSFRLDVSTITDGGIVHTKERSEFIRWAPVYQLDSEWIDKPVVISGIQYVIKGLNSKKRKHPVLLQNISNQKMYCFGADVVRAMMRGAK
jgi:hypothetical protein